MTSHAACLPIPCAARSEPLSVAAFAPQDGKTIVTNAANLASDTFDFESEFALLDVGATSSLLRVGTVRPIVLAFTPNGGVESVALRWDAADDSESENGVQAAWEEARRFVRDLEPVAYAFIAHVSRRGSALHYHLPDPKISAARAPVSALPNEHLAVAMFAQDGTARGMLYPIRRTGTQISFGMPAVTDAESTDWSPLGDLWSNPFCLGDLAQFRPRERAVDPSTPLWQAIVELTRMRLHEDQANADEYMSFLDDLRNGLFRVSGRPADVPTQVILRPRTSFNPLGTLTVEADRLLLAGRQTARVENVGRAKNGLHTNSSTGETEPTASRSGERRNSRVENR